MFGESPFPATAILETLKLLLKSNANPGNVTIFCSDFREASSLLPLIAFCYPLIYTWRILLATLAVTSLQYLAAPAVTHFKIF